MEINKRDRKKYRKSIKNLILWKEQQNWQNFSLINRDKRDGTQVAGIRNERWDAPTVLKEIERIMKEYYEQLYADKLDIPNKIGKVLETQISKRTWE